MLIWYREGRPQAPFWGISSKISLSEHSFPAPELWNSALYTDVARSHLITAELLSKREDEAGENYVGKPGRTWETLSENHWITRICQNKSLKVAQPRGRHAIHPLHAGRCSASPRHSRTTSRRLITPAARTTLHPHVQPGARHTCTSHRAPATQTPSSTRSPSRTQPLHAPGPAPTCALRCGTCNPDSIAPIHRAAASATRPGSRLPRAPPQRQRGPVPAMPTHLQPKPGPTYTSLLLSLLHPPTLGHPSCSRATARGAPSSADTLPVSPPGGGMPGREEGCPAGRRDAQPGCSPGREAQLNFSRPKGSRDRPRRSSALPRRVSCAGDGGDPAAGSDPRCQ